MESRFKVLTNTRSQMIKSLLLVGIGGAAGSVLRFCLQRIGNGPGFPCGTLFINLTGCLLIGLLWGVLVKQGESEWIKLLVMTGFCGGFTTFSAFTLESLQLLTANRWLLFSIYITFSVLGGLFATFIGYKITS